MVPAPHGDMAVYVAHLPSIRIRPRDGLGSGRRDESAAAPGAAIAAEKLETVILLGDLNVTLGEAGKAGRRMRKAADRALGGGTVNGLSRDG